MTSVRRALETDETPGLMKAVAVGRRTVFSARPCSGSDDTRADERFPEQPAESPPVPEQRDE